jgi:hypothetical protein
MIFFFVQGTHALGFWVACSSQPFTLQSSEWHGSARTAAAVQGQTLLLAFFMRCL